MKVIKRFRDKHTKKIYDVGATYKHDNRERINELIEIGFIEEVATKLKEVSSNTSQPYPLGGNVKQVQQRLDDYDADALKELLTEEQDGLNRKGVTEYIKKRM